MNLVLSVSSSPSLDEAWRELAESRKQFARSRWLATRSTSWFRQTEVTHTPQGWHLHDNWLVWGSTEQQQTVLHDSIPRWLDCATRADTHADVRGQHATLTREAAQVIGYVVKGLMAQHDSHTTAQGRTPGDLLALFHSGDADAADAYAALESAFLVRGRRWVERGGDLRAKKQNYDLCA